MQKQYLSLACLGVLVFLGFVAPLHAQTISWSEKELRQLDEALADAHANALSLPDTSRLQAARATGDSHRIDEAAADLALDLARRALLGSTPMRERAGWHVVDTDRQIDLAGWLERAREAGALATFFAALWPDHPDYRALREAFAKETDPDRRVALARNMERWRWMPHRLGKDYVLVNTANFLARLWREGRKVGQWRVIVGKLSTPSPAFSATIRGVILNPWWNIPESIVREKRGRFPASKGYVQVDGRWRQKPGPNNALGQMKLDMPNPYSVYMHDTPSKSLFEREVRAFSHGCIRTGDAIGFAKTLLKGTASSEKVDAILEARANTSLRLAAPLPIYITYFTVAPDEAGALHFFSDIYQRDARMTPAAAVLEPCPD